MNNHTTAHSLNPALRKSRVDAMHHEGVHSINMKKHPKKDGVLHTPHHTNGHQLLQKAAEHAASNGFTQHQTRPPQLQRSNGFNPRQHAQTLMAQQQYPPGTGQRMLGQSRPPPQNGLHQQASVPPLKRSHHDLLRQHNEEYKQQKAKKDALKESQASFGKYVAVDSKHFNFILPVLPKPPDETQKG